MTSKIFLLLFVVVAYLSAQANTVIGYPWLENDSQIGFAPDNMITHPFWNFYCVQEILPETSGCWTFSNANYGDAVCKLGATVRNRETGFMWDTQISVRKAAEGKPVPYAGNTVFPFDRILIYRANTAHLGIAKQVYNQDLVPALLTFMNGPNNDVSLSPRCRGTGSSLGEAVLDLPAKMKLDQTPTPKSRNLGSQREVSRGLGYTRD